MKAQPIGLVLLAALWAAAAPGVTVDRVEPPFWWAGMAHDRVQVLLYGPELGRCEVSLEHPGLALEEVTRVESPNYLFLTLRTDSALAPGTAALQLVHPGGERLTVPYVFREREAGSAERAGFSATDAIYLLMPDRFANGNPANDSVPSLRETAVNRAEPYGRHGGDLAGVLRHLDYFRDLGFTAIWMNPFQENDQASSSYHGYAITDLYRVDPRLGDHDSIRALAGAARAASLKLIMDVVPNHIGDGHWWMRDLPSPQWLNQIGTRPQTNHQRTTHLDPYADPDDARRMVEGWFVAEVPDLNVTHRLLGDYLIQNSVWWIEELGLSGLRVDTYSYPDRAYMRRWVDAILREYPRLNLVGEEWSVHPPSVAFWQRGSRHPSGYVGNLPSLFDFPAQQALVESLTAPERWNRGFVQLYEVAGFDFLYPDPGNLVIFAGNHDIERIFPQLGEDTALARNALVWLATFRGIPQFYSGDEILQTHPPGAGHGVLRGDFPGGWPGDAVDAFSGRNLPPGARAFQELVGRLFRWRATQKALHRGGFFHYAPENKTYAYFRVTPGEGVFVVLNYNPAPVTLDLARFHRWVRPGQEGRDVLADVPLVLPAALTLPPKEPFVFSFTRHP